MWSSPRHGPSTPRQSQSSEDSNHSSGHVCHVISFWVQKKMHPIKESSTGPPRSTAKVTQSSDAMLQCQWTNENMARRSRSLASVLTS